MMKIGQMSLPKLSSCAHYLQLDVCGLSPSEAIHKYNRYAASISVVLHGDWRKKGCSENNIVNRVEDYIEMIRRLQEKTKVLGITIHPPFRKKVAMEVFLDCCRHIASQTGVEVWIENRSNSKIWLSDPEEIVHFSQHHRMTVDIPQLYISCGFSLEKMVQVCKQLYLPHIRELHLANVQRKGNRTFVARKLLDGKLDIFSFLSIFHDVPYCTLEILGGVSVFEHQFALLQEWLQKTQEK